MHFSSSRELNESWDERGRVAGVEERVWRPGNRRLPSGKRYDGPEAVL